LESESLRVRFQKLGDGQPDIPDNAAAPADTAPNFEDVPRFQGGADSQNLAQADFALQRDANNNPIPKTGLAALEKADLFNLLCIPPEVRNEDTLPAIYQLALPLCVKRRAMLIVDSPFAWGANSETAADNAKNGLGGLGLAGTDARNAAIYFPRVIQADPLREGQSDTFVPCGIIAGIMAKTDVQRGVWKAPAGIDAGLSGIQGLQVDLSNDENGVLNPLGINCLRNFPPVYGRVVWGARTLRGADQLADEYKYLPVRRMVLFLEESLYRGTQWVVFEPNDEPLWSQIRLNIGAFMNGLFRQGAFQGKSPKDAYFVKCDSETTTQYDIDRGIVNIIVGFAPLKPAEFVILKFQQMTKQAEA
jgi:phage tail sheath protein FI